MTLLNKEVFSSELILLSILLLEIKAVNSESPAYLANCVFGGGTCFSSDSNESLLTVSTIVVFIVTLFFGIFASILVICCYVKCCPCYGECEKGWKNY